MDLDSISVALTHVVTLPGILYLGLGMIIGFMVGLLPGLGSTVTMAIMIPFTFGMPPEHAFILLLGMYSVTAIAGDITSILLGIPGEVTTIALIEDGHPMARRGEGGRALGAALMASILGGLAGAVILFLLIGILAPASKHFGAPELFMLMVASLCFVATISGKNLLKGLIVATLGVALATVGQDPTIGIERFTFGSDFLLDGVPLIPVAIGLYGLPEIVELATGRSVAGDHSSGLGGRMKGVMDVWQRRWLTLRCGVLGTVIGVVPGLGGSVAQWVAYGHGIQSSKDKRMFGRGDVAGVIAPASATNSKEGGNLLTLLTFGIPTTPVMAMLLGALLMQGIVPGPDMVTMHTSLVYTMVWVIIVAHVLGGLLCLVFTSQFAKITQVPGDLLAPFLIVLVFVGAYIERSEMFDVWFMMFWGCVGVGMVRVGWPRVPLILGLVLGPLMDKYLSITVQRYGAVSWLSHPIVIGTLIVVIIAISVTVTTRLRARRPVAAADVPAQGSE